MQDNTLFVYFCGTEEETGKHVSRLMPAVEAKYHLYINGVASGRTDFQNLSQVLLKDFKKLWETPGWTQKYPAYESELLGRIHDLKVTKIPGASNSQSCSFTYRAGAGPDGGRRQVYTIEKQYDGYRMASIKGYSENDIKKVVTYTFHQLLTILQQHKEIKHVVFGGHSRGAAVGLSSFLYYLLESLDKARPGELPTARKALKSLDKIDVLFLDPVAGQQGSANYYRMVHKRDWTTTDLYHALHEELTNLNSITEVYANAAQMVGKYMFGLRSFNPSKSFLEDFHLQRNNLFKFFLGFSHSAMVDPLDSKGLPYVYDRIQAYEKIPDYRGEFLSNLFQRLNKGKKPFELIVSLINSYSEFTQGTQNNKTFYHRHYASFADSDSIFAKLVAQYNDPKIKDKSHKLPYKGKDCTQYEILNDIFPKSEVVDQVLGYIKLRRDAFYVNRRGEKTSLAELVTNNALSFGVTPIGVFELEEAVRHYFEENEDVGDAVRKLFEDAEEEEAKEAKRIEAEHKKTKQSDDKKSKPSRGDDNEDDSQKSNGKKDSKVIRKREEDEDEDEDEDDDKKDKRSEREKIEDERASRAKKRRQAIQELLEATGGNIPDFYNEVSKELRKQMSVENHLAFDPPGYLKFEEGVFRTPDLASANLTKSVDFYALSQAEQKLLYDRVGLFKGIVIDHSKDIPVQQGFRDVLKREKTVPPKGVPADEQTDVVRVLFKRPRLSGYYESTYTFDESERKSQEVGVFSLGFGLAVNYSSFKTAVGVRAGFNYGHQHMHQGSSHKKRMDVTSSFFLPKIDLSFDALRPCAADDFVEAVRQAMLNVPGGGAPFLRLCKVLQHYGHFVPLNLLIGGRLYSVNTKEVTETKEIDDTLTEYNAKLQVAVETWTTDVGIDSTMNTTDAQKAAARKKSENQSLRVTAVGGEGAYVNNANKWVESLAHFSQWGLVKFDNLIPSLQVLPPALQLQCRSAILDYVQGTTIDDLLSIGAHFLFYTGYMEEYGSKAVPKFFYIQHVLSGKVVSIENGTMANGTKVGLRPIEGADSQLWWLDASGKLLSKKGYFEQEVYALTAQGNNLVITQNNFFPGQYWELGGGIIRNLESEVALKLHDSTKPSESIVLQKPDNQHGDFNGWRIVNPNQITPTKTAKAVVAPKLVANNAAVLLSDHYLNLDHCMASPNGKVLLHLKAEGLKISHRDITKALWEKAQAGSKELHLRDGKLELVFKKDDNTPAEVAVLYQDQLNPAHSLELLDNGSLELLDINKEVVWQSGSIVYAVIKSDVNQGVLSIYHIDYAPDANRDKPQVMLMPYVGADHQLWYINRNGQIVSKMKRNGTASIVLTCNEHGAVSLQPLETRNQHQRWQVGESGGAIHNRHLERKLAHADHGKPITAERDVVGYWHIIPEIARHGKSFAMHFKTPHVNHHEGTDYHRYHDHRGGKGDKGSYTHLGRFRLERPIRGLSFFETSERVALAAYQTSAQDQLQQQDNRNTGDGYIYHLLRDFFLDKSPIYLPQADGLTLGLCAKSNRTAIYVEDASGHQLKNEDWNDDNYIKVNGGFGYMQMAPVKAESDEQVVGVGITTLHGNRFSPYLLVLKSS